MKRQITQHTRIIITNLAGHSEIFYFENGDTIEITGNMLRITNSDKSAKLHFLKGSRNHITSVCVKNEYGVYEGIV